MIKPIGDRSVLEKRIPKSVKYEHVKPTLDTGLTIEKFIQRHGGENAIHARFRREEHFGRIKSAELAKFVMIQSSKEASEETHDDNVEKVSTSQLLLNTSNESLLIPNDQISEEELLIQQRADKVNKVLQSNMLLLDIRDSEAYEKCHIACSILYEAPRLTRSVNALTPEILAFKNNKGRMIVIYDYDEKIAPNTGNLFFEKGFDNVYVLTGGLKMMAEKFPNVLVGIPPTPPASPKKKKTKSTVRSSSTSRVSSTRGSIDFSPRSSISSLRSSTSTIQSRASVGGSTAPSSSTTSSTTGTARARARSTSRVPNTTRSMAPSMTSTSVRSSISNKTWR